MNQFSTWYHLFITWYHLFHKTDREKEVKGGRALVQNTTKIMPIFSGNIIRGQCKFLPRSVERALVAIKARKKSLRSTKGAPGTIASQIEGSCRVSTGERIIISDHNKFPSYSEEHDASGNQGGKGKSSECECSPGPRGLLVRWQIKVSRGIFQTGWETNGVNHLADPPSKIQIVP